MDADESFEIAAKAFYKATGMLMPGKDIGSGMGWSEEEEEERQKLFRVWCAAVAYMQRVHAAGLAEGEAKALRKFPASTVKKDLSESYCGECQNDHEVKLAAKEVEIGNILCGREDLRAGLAVLTEDRDSWKREHDLEKKARLEAEVREKAYKARLEVTESGLVKERDILMDAIAEAPHSLGCVTELHPSLQRLCDCWKSEAIPSSLRGAKTHWQARAEKAEAGVAGMRACVNEIIRQGPCKGCQDQPESDQCRQARIYTMAKALSSFSSSDSGAKIAAVLEAAVFAYGQCHPDGQCARAALGKLKDAVKAWQAAEGGS